MKARFQRDLRERLSKEGYPILSDAAAVTIVVLCATGWYHDCVPGAMALAVGALLVGIRVLDRLSTARSSGAAAMPPPARPQAFGVLRFDDDGRLVQMNDDARRILGDSSGILYGIRLDDLAASFAKVSAGIRLLAVEGEDASGPRVCLLLAGEWTEPSAAADRAPSVSEVRAAAGMVARMAHEVRNPIAAISGSAQLLERLPATMESSDRDELFRCIVSESDRLDQILNRFLALGEYPDARLAELSRFAESPMTVGATPVVGARDAPHAEHEGSLVGAST